ncbi:MAG: hypothetical protein ACLTYN_09115 [Dysosmobacter welbionis]
MMDATISDWLPSPRWGRGTYEWMKDHIETAPALAAGPAGGNQSLRCLSLRRAEF